jgi:hypothetical protein
VPQPFGEHAHGSTGVGVDLGFALGAGFGKAEAMENFDHQVDAHSGADDGDEDAIAAKLGGDWAAGWGVVDRMGMGGSFTHKEIKIRVILLSSRRWSCMKAEAFDQKFDESQEDIIDDLDLSQLRRPGYEQQGLSTQAFPTHRPGEKADEQAHSRDF